VLFPERPFGSRCSRARKCGRASTRSTSTRRRRTGTAPRRARSAKYLVNQELLETNFVRDIEGFGENDPRLVYYEIDDAKR
jgi:hypothetical protein